MCFNLRRRRGIHSESLKDPLDLNRYMTMTKTMRWLSLTLVFTAMVTQFNNCGNYADTPTYSASASSVTCDSDSCSPKSIDNLSLQVNLGGNTEYSVTPDLGVFNMGGDCNEGGFPFNTVKWELYLNNVKVRDSSMAGLNGAGNANTRCVNGRFTLFVNLSAISEDPVDRTGLQIPGSTVNNLQRRPYDLWVEIYGQETAGGAPQRNLLKARKRISLIAI